MKISVERWIAESRTKLTGTPLVEADLDQLEALIEEPRQLIMYLTATSTNLRSGVVSWVIFDPTKKQQPELPKDRPPYASVLDAVADGWKVTQFPVINLFDYKDLENDYVGFDFILEKMI
ncbi:MAG: hypothetical protein HOH43_22230 [Candidatus Latescibacteria bacterium]|jgi:hypothetical protein|nr:hypothetical protein [Candidatus Latescibacterota bacterium]